MDYKERSLRMHKEHGGKLSVEPKVSLDTQDDLSTYYSPGVAAPSTAIAEDPEAVYDYTIKGNTVAIVSDGSAVLGLGNIGAAAAIPVMEGKAALFKKFAGIDAFPICLDTQDTDEIVETVRRIAPVFGGINLEDISAPRCFEVEERLQDLGIPVFHDDQHGTAIVASAALLNAARVVGKEVADLCVVINGAGAAGVAIMKLLSCVNTGDAVCTSVKEVIMSDSQGVIYKGREGLSPVKEQIAEQTNSSGVTGSLADALENADVFIGVSAANILTGDMVRSMAENPIIFALANPTPEIDPAEAKAAGAAVIATGRSDYPNQVNNVLAFPGIFQGALSVRAPRITESMKLAAVKALAELVPEPTEDQILPKPLDERVAPAVAEAVKRAAAE